MKTREIFEKLKSGEMTLDFAGHRTNHSLEYLIQRYESDVAFSQGANDGKWSNPDADTDANMRDFYLRKLEFEVEENEPVILFDRRVCWRCAESMQWVLTGNTLQLKEHIVPDKTTRFGIRFENYPSDYVCEYAAPRVFKGKIQVQSPLVFANFFRELDDAPEEVKYTEKWSLNNLKGREQITRYKEEHNVAYGQMSNMGIAIYLHENKRSIIVGTDNHPADYQEFDSDEEYQAAANKPIFEGYEKVGEICLGVWRWEATDWNTLKKLGYSPEKLKEEHKYVDFVQFDVPFGTWAFEHYFDDCCTDDMILYSRFDLVS